MANEFTRIAHAVSGGSSAPIDLNASKDSTLSTPECVLLQFTSTQQEFRLPVFGWKNIAITLNGNLSGSNVKVAFLLANGTTTEFTNTPISENVFTSDMLIPDTAVAFCIKTQSSVSTYYRLWYALTN